ncbi:unnamed protein product [Meganyctiphanes norvegica]|uniref:Uncharacterized protein n=1 Tax=Meganyctiphanes norvegica TaxID=48144 RepID=A0AAV2QLN4_MEGNR
MKASSHMTAVMGAGVGGFFVGGPGAAVGLAAAAGMAMDGITTGVEFAVSKEYKPEGILRPLSDPKNPGVWIDAIGGVAMDGVAGYGAGRIANAVKMSTTITGFEHSDLARGVSASKAPKGILPIKAEAKSIHNEDDKVNSNEKDKLRAKSIHNDDAKVNSDEKNKLSPKKRRRKVSEVFDGLRHRITSRTSKEDKSNEKNKAENIPMQTIITDEVDVFQNSESISSQEHNTEEEEEESQSGFSSGFETDDDLSEESSDDESDSIQHSLAINIVQDTIRRNSSCGSYPGWRDDFVLFKKTVFEQDLT